MAIDQTSDSKQKFAHSPKKETAENPCGFNIVVIGGDVRGLSISKSQIS